ncbi:MAG: type 4a pilus biogenesis protein PilO [Bdellovibrionaceae bacterium]|nr:type 4a pilus biogenesis protein PilO [Pseudobdellovibrionaceae bacterium]
MQQYILQLGEMTWSKVIVGGLIALGAYWGLYYDNGERLETEIQQLTTRLTESERQLRETKEAMADAERFEKLVRQNEIQFEKVMEYLPQDTNSNELTRLVNQVSQLSGARVKATQPMSVAERKDFYEMTRIKVDLQGSFSQVVLFLSSLSKVQKLLTFDNLEIKTLEEGAVIGEGETPPVTLEATMVGYRYLKDQETAADANRAGGTGAPNP